MPKPDHDFESKARAGDRRIEALRAERWYANYNRLTAVALPGVLAYTLWRRYGMHRSAASLHGQWGHVPEAVCRTLDSGDRNAPRIWLHAVSVGEQIAARPVLRALRKALPASHIALSVTTDTGYETAGAAVRAHEADAVFYFPVDAPIAIKRTLRAIKPDVFLTMETELWPNMLHLAKTFGAKTFLVNGRVSDNLMRRAPRLGWIWRWMLLNLDGLLMRSAGDAARIERLGAPRERVRSMGDVKLDAIGPGDDAAVQRAQWRERLGLGENALLWVAGSTHAGEEEIVLAAYHSLKPRFPELRLVVAPRHIERASDAARALGTAGDQVVKRSEWQDEKSSLSLDAAILLLDTVGELSALYAAADVSFVGGSLIPRGGHNLLEPVLRGVGVTPGPYIDNFREAAALVESAGAGRLVHNAEELAAALSQWLGDATVRRELAARAAAALAEHQGAAGRVAAAIVASLVKA